MAEKPAGRRASPDQFVHVCYVFGDVVLRNEQSSSSYQVWFVITGITGLHAYTRTLILLCSWVYQYRDQDCIAFIMSACVHVTSCSLTAKVDTLLSGGPVLRWD